MNGVPYSNRLYLVRMKSTLNNLVIIQVYMPTEIGEYEDVEQRYALRHWRIDEICESEWQGM